MYTRPYRIELRIKPQISLAFCYPASIVVNYLLNHLFLFVLFAACLVLAGCAVLRQPSPSLATTSTTTPTTSATTPATATATAQSWRERYQQLSQIQSWTIKGSTSIRHDNKTDMASLSWTQQFRQYN